MLHVGEVELDTLKNLYHSRLGSNETGSKEVMLALGGCASVVDQQEIRSTKKKETNLLNPPPPSRGDTKKGSW